MQYNIEQPKKKLNISEISEHLQICNLMFQYNVYRCFKLYSCKLCVRARALYILHLYKCNLLFIIFIMMEFIKFLILDNELGSLRNLIQC